LSSNPDSTIHTPFKLDILDIMSHLEKESLSLHIRKNIKALELLRSVPTRPLGELLGHGHIKALKKKKFSRAKKKKFKAQIIFNKAQKKKIVNKI
jgi:hypothetical protein